MSELDLAREEIDRIDAEMAALFERRMRACAAIAAYKRANGLPVRDSGREEAVIRRCRALIADGEIEPYYVQFLRHTIDLSCRYQTRLLGGGAEEREA